MMEVSVVVPNGSDTRAPTLNWLIVQLSGTTITLPLLNAAFVAPALLPVAAGWK
jgi:hypothetical protein